MMVLVVLASVGGTLVGVILGAVVMFIGLRGMSAPQITQAMRGIGQWFGRAGPPRTGQPGRTASVVIDPLAVREGVMAVEPQAPTIGPWADFNDLAVADAWDRMQDARTPDDIDEVMGET